MTEFGKLLVFARPEFDNGPILAADQPFLDEIHQVGWDIADHNLPVPHKMGLQIFEGWIEMSSGPDPNPSFVGEWRSLTHWEMCRVRHGMVPWD